MEELIGLSVLGLCLVTLGIINILGYIKTIHWYNRRKVTEEDAPKYGKLIGSGTVVIGGTVIVSALLAYLLSSELPYYLVIPGIAVGLIMMLYAQIKYNRGIF